GVFDRGKPLPDGGRLAQADGTAWMAFYATSMLAIALELAKHDPVYEDLAARFFEQFAAIAEAINAPGAAGLWDETDGFYYDRILHDHLQTPVRLRSMVGLVPLFAALVLNAADLESLPHFRERVSWLLENRPELARHVALLGPDGGAVGGRWLLSIPRREQLERVLAYLLDETELLSPHGIRSLSRRYAEEPYVLTLDGTSYGVRYAPGESRTSDFGANSNWRGPVWFPLNYLLIEALQEYHRFYGENLRVECPAGSGVRMNLGEVAEELARRLSELFRRGPGGSAPWQGTESRYREDPHWRDLLQFHEYFHGDTGRGLGASHQTGWTALVFNCLELLARARSG
ncbi:MAG TPA: glucosidase, partial [Armatimonadota bacterium]|nr:glucosidase [Armatimonadota bacterium]